MAKVRSVRRRRPRAAPAVRGEAAGRPPGGRARGGASRKPASRGPAAAGAVGPGSPRARALAFLEAHHVLTLATAGPGGPWAAAVLYASHGFTLFFLSAPTTRHARSLAADPRAAGTIQADTGAWRAVKGVQLEGTVRLLAGDEADRARRLLAARFPVIAAAPAPIAAALARVGWYALTPRRLWLVDNAQGFGHRDEIPLP